MYRYQVTNFGDLENLQKAEWCENPSLSVQSSTYVFYRSLMVC
jgi:hypothetical protein